jgi:hypothetical protein
MMTRRSRQVRRRIVIVLVAIILVVLLGRCTRSGRTVATSCTGRRRRPV